MQTSHHPFKTRRRHVPLLAFALATSMDIAVDVDGASIDLPAQPLAITLNNLAKSTNTKLIYADSAVQGLQADALKDSFTVRQALDKALSRYGLQYEQVGEGVIALKKAPQPKPHAVKDNSIFELGAVTVSDQNVLAAYDLFHRMPGVQITQFSQGTTTGKLSFRGFNGEG